MKKKRLTAEQRRIAAIVADVRATKAKRDKRRKAIAAKALETRRANERERQHERETRAGIRGEAPNVFEIPEGWEPVDLTGGLNERVRAAQERAAKERRSTAARKGWITRKLDAKQKARRKKSRKAATKSTPHFVVISETNTVVDVRRVELVPGTKTERLSIHEARMLEAGNLHGANRDQWRILKDMVEAHDPRWEEFLAECEAAGMSESQAYDEWFSPEM